MRPGHWQARAAHDYRRDTGRRESDSESESISLCFAPLRLHRHFRPNRRTPAYAFGLVPRRRGGPAHFQLEAAEPRPAGGGPPANLNFRPTMPGIMVMIWNPPPATVTHRDTGTASLSRSESDGQQTVTAARNHDHESMIRGIPERVGSKYLRLMILLPGPGGCNGDS